MRSSRRQKSIHCLGNGLVPVIDNLTWFCQSPADGTEAESGDWAEKLDGAGGCALQLPQ